MARGANDPAYEEQGNDYPFGLVRWTEQRNFEAVLGLMADGKLDIGNLISHRFGVDAAGEAYDLLANGAPLGIIIEYPAAAEAAAPTAAERKVALEGASAAPQSGVIGMIGAGNYAGQVLIPAFRDAGAGLGLLASAGGVSSVHAGKKYGFASATTDADAVAVDDSIDTVVVATRHDSHARYAIAALNAGKNVFVEKPLALNREELDAIRAAYDTAVSRGR